MKNQSAESYWHNFFAKEGRKEGALRAVVWPPRPYGRASLLCIDACMGTPPRMMLVDQHTGRHRHRAQNRQADRRRDETSDIQSVELSIGRHASMSCAKF